MITGAISVEPAAFAAAVAWAAKFIGRSAQPIQACLLLRAGDGVLSVQAIGENVEATARVPFTGDGAGSVIVSGKLLAEISKTFRGNAVVLTADEGDLAVTAGRWSGTLPALPGEEWPGGALVRPESVAEIGGDALAAIIGQAGTAASDDEKKPIGYQCIHLIFGDYALTAMGTGGHQVGWAYAPYKLSDALIGRAEGSASATTFGHVLVDAAGSFTGWDTVEIGLGPNVIALTSPSREVVIRQVIIDGGYGLAPVIEQIIHAELPRTALVPTAKLLTPMKAANIMRGEKDGPITVTFREGVISLSAGSTQVKQRGAEDVDVDYSGPEHVVALNPRYFADALGSAPGEQVAVHFNEATKPNGLPWHVTLTVPDNKAWAYVLMPIKVR